jgi:hypothetical protein
MDRTSICPSESVDRASETKLCESWTEVLTQFMFEHFQEFANNKGKCENGSQVERLVRKWAYVVRLADWCYHEGILSRCRYMHWVLNLFQVSLKEPINSSSWSAELLLPLIANVFPDLCRLRTEIPELIRVCVSRYMKELMQMPSSMSVQGSSAAGMMQTPTTALLANLRKLVQSLLVIYPEAFVSLSMEVQAAWRLIETETNLRDMNTLKAALRQDVYSAVPNHWLHHAMPWVECERRVKHLINEAGPVSKILYMCSFCCCAERYSRFFCCLSVMKCFVGVSENLFVAITLLAFGMSCLRSSHLGHSHVYTFKAHWTYTRHVCLA